MKLFKKSGDSTREEAEVAEKYAGAEAHLVAGEWPAVGDWAKKRLADDPQDLVAEFLFLSSEVINRGYYRVNKELVPELQKKLRSQKELESRAKVLYQWLENLRKRKAGSAWVNFVAGVAYFITGRHRDGISAMKEAVTLKPDFFWASMELASAYSEQGNHKEAIIWAGKAVAVHPDYVEAHLVLAHAYVGRKSYDEATGELQKCLELDPQMVDAWNDLAAVKIEQKLPTEAITCAEKAIAIDPECKNAYINLGSALMHMDKLDEAAGAYEKVLAIDRDDVSALYNLAITMEKAGHFGKAIQYCDRMLSLGDKLPSGLRGNLEHAIKVLQQKWEQQP